MRFECSPLVVDPKPCRKVPNTNEDIDSANHQQQQQHESAYMGALNNVLVLNQRLVVMFNIQTVTPYLSI